MILGAGLYQLPAIKKAVDLGCYVITVDYLPHNIGHKFSHHYVNVSTVDMEGVFQAADRLGIDGICTFSSDVALPTVGYVCDHLGLAGVSMDVAEILTNKQKFRSFMVKHNRQTPRFVSGKIYESVYEEMMDLTFPVMVKPVDSSGSRGITKIETRDSNKAAASFQKAKYFSRSGTVCIEEYVNGVEVGGDGVLVDGHFAFIAITQKYLDGFIVTGHRLPTGISPQDQKRVINTLEDCCQTLGYRNGALNFDVIIGDDHVTIIEISGRTGGNGIPSIIKRTTSFDVEVAAIKSALGEKIEFINQGNADHGCGSIVFGSKSSGILHKIATFEELRNGVPEVHELNLAIQEGHPVEAVEHNGHMIGYAVFDCADAGEYVMVSDKISSMLNIVIKER